MSETQVDVSPEERDLLLAALFEMRIAHAERLEQIDALVLKLGGDPDTAFFGAYRHERGAAPPVPEYPTDETDEG